MTQWSVDVDGLARSAQQLEQCGVRLQQVQNSIEDIRRNIRRSSSSMIGAYNQLGYVTQSLNRQTQKVQTLSGSLNGCTQRYRTTEQALTNPASHPRPQTVNTSHNDAGSDTSNDAPDWASYIFSAIGGVGGIGASINLLYHAATGNKIKVASSSIKMAGKVLDAYLSDGPFLKNFIGNAVRAKNNAATTSWWSRFTQNLGEKVGITAKVAKAVGAVVTWGSALIERTAQNLDEFNGLTGRCVAEIGVETVLKVGQGVLIGAAISATLVSSPAWLVGGVTAVAILGVDALLNLAVKKDSDNADVSWLEVVSDGICDFGTQVATGAKKVFENVTSGIAKWFSPRGALA